MRKTRVWYVTDLHGSVLCFLKLLAVACQASKLEFLDAIVVGGDLCGERLVPILSAGETWLAQLEGEDVQIRSEDALQEFRTRLALKGHYSYVCDSEGASRLADAEHAQDILDRLASQRLSRWLSQLAEVVPAADESPCPIIVNTGTGDPPAADELLADNKHVFFAENEVVTLRTGVSVASTSYRDLVAKTNSSPVARRRKLAEPEFRERLRLLTARVPDMRNCIFNLHVPPAPTLIDRLPSQRTMPSPEVHIGSVVIRQAIEFGQPTASLHGYVHSGRGAHVLGKTVALNPGSEFYNGRLVGVLVDISDDGVQHSFTDDPLLEAQLKTDEKLFHAILKAVAKHGIPVVGTLYKAVDDVLKEIRDNAKR